MGNIKLLCRNAHPFLPNGGSLDEEAWRWHCNWQLDSGINLAPGSGGIGEAYTMTRAELKRVFEIAVQESKGKLPVYANPGERHTYQDTLDNMRLAIDAGCEFVNVYAPQGLHAMHPTDGELMAYYDAVLPKLKCDVIISVNRAVGYTQSAKLIGAVINKHSNVKGAYLTSVNERFHVQLRDIVKRDIDYIVQIFGSFNNFIMGARGLTVTAANLLPKTHRAFIDAFEKRDFAAVAPLNAGLLRFNDVVRAPEWEVRWVKMAWRLFKLPGGQGGIRNPHLMIPDGDMERFTNSMRGIGLPEMDELFKKAGLG